MKVIRLVLFENLLVIAVFWAMYPDPHFERSKVVKNEQTMCRQFILKKINTSCTCTYMPIKTNLAHRYTHFKYVGLKEIFVVWGNLHCYINLNLILLKHLSHKIVWNDMAFTCFQCFVTKKHKDSYVTSIQVGNQNKMFPRIHFTCLYWGYLLHKWDYQCRHCMIMIWKLMKSSLFCLVCLPVIFYNTER